MFRKSHLLPAAPHLFNSKKQLTKGDYTPEGHLLLSDGAKLSNFVKGSSRFLFHSFQAPRFVPRQLLAMLFALPPLVHLGTCKRSTGWIALMFSMCSPIPPLSPNCVTIYLRWDLIPGHMLDIPFAGGSIICVPIGHPYRIN